MKILLRESKAPCFWQSASCAREGSNLLAPPPPMKPGAWMTCLFKSGRKVLPLNLNNSRKRSEDAGWKNVLSPGLSQLRLPCSTCHCQGSGLPMHGGTCWCSRVPWCSVLGLFSPWSAFCQFCLFSVHCSPVQVLLYTGWAVPWDCTVCGSPTRPHWSSEPTGDGCPLTLAFSFPKSLSRKWPIRGRLLWQPYTHPVPPSPPDFLSLQR